MIRNYFWPALRPAEKPVLLEALSTRWGCDEPSVAAMHRTLIETKKLFRALSKGDVFDWVQRHKEAL